jgi:hypothetical protein
VKEKVYEKLPEGMKHLFFAGLAIPEKPSPIISILLENKYKAIFFFLGLKKNNLKTTESLFCILILRNTLHLNK